MEKHVQVSKWIALAILGVAIADMPIGYYTFTRLTCGPILLFYAYYSHSTERVAWMWCFGILGLLYNPVVPIYLGDKGAWAAINVATIACILFGTRRGHVTPEDSPEKRTTERKGAATGSTSTGSSSRADSEVKIRTHYDNLQVARNASPEVIKGAYRFLSQKWHPDKNPENLERAEKVTKIINRAYEVLIDPELRAAHDDWIKQEELGHKSSSSMNDAEPDRGWRKDEKRPKEPDEEVQATEQGYQARNRPDHNAWTRLANVMWWAVVLLGVVIAALPFVLDAPRKFSNDALWLVALGMGVVGGCKALQGVWAPRLLLSGAAFAEWLSLGIFWVMLSEICVIGYLAIDSGRFPSFRESIWFAVFSAEFQNLALIAVAPYASVRLVLYVFGIRDTRERQVEDIVNAQATSPSPAPPEKPQQSSSKTAEPTEADLRSLRIVGFFMSTLGFSLAFAEELDSPLGSFPGYWFGIPSGLFFSFCTLAIHLNYLKLKKKGKE